MINGAGRLEAQIDGIRIEAHEGWTILEAVRRTGGYIPTLCHHPDLPPIGSCGLCVVEVDGKDSPVQACDTTILPGMVIKTISDDLARIRQERLSIILATHPHACLVCSQNEGCDRRTCSSDVPVEERCCDIFNDCELRRLAEYIGIRDDTPRYRPGGIEVITDALISRNYELCVGCGRCVNVCWNYRKIKALGELPETPEMLDHTCFPADLGEAGCQYCGSCIQVCPTGALEDIAPVVGRAPCQYSCPANIDIPNFIRQTAEANFNKALSTIYESIPFPGTLGRVCYHPCEGECRRGALDKPGSIMRLKRFLFEYVDDDDIDFGRKFRPSGKKIVVIGSGPAGLTSAFYLAKWGHEVKVFESRGKAGGMLRYGIPNFRLPKEVLDREISMIERMGVEIMTHSPIRSIDDQVLKDRDAIILAIGAQKGGSLGISGEELPWVMDALEFLRKVLEDSMDMTGFISRGMKVGIIGGGNTAMDSARTALRLGASVTVFYRRTENEMPAYREEMEEARKEGVDFRFLASPTAIKGCGEVLDVEFAEMELGPAEHDGRRRPVPTQQYFNEKLDRLIIATGQDIQVPEGLDAFIGSGGAITFNEDSLEIKKGLYICGDIARLSNVVESVEMGRRAAENVHLALGGPRFTTAGARPSPRTTEHEVFLGERAMPECGPDTRSLCFDEMSMTLGHETVVCEAGRCLQCDLRTYLSEVPHPPLDIFIFDPGQLSSAPEAGGVLILYDDDKKIIEIKGTPNIREELAQRLEAGAEAGYFKFEEDPMYSKRESELLQEHIQKHGEMPTGGDDLDDLF